MSFIDCKETQTFGDQDIYTNGPYIHTNPLLYSHPRLNLTKKKFLHSEGSQKEVKNSQKKKDMNLAVRVGEFIHVLHIPHNLLLLKVRVYS